MLVAVVSFGSVLRLASALVFARGDKSGEFRPRPFGAPDRGVGIFRKTAPCPADYARYPALYPETRDGRHFCTPAPADTALASHPAWKTARNPRGREPRRLLNIIFKGRGVFGEAQKLFLKTHTGWMFSILMTLPNPAMGTPPSRIGFGKVQIRSNYWEFRVYRAPVLFVRLRSDPIFRRYFRDWTFPRSWLLRRTSKIGKFRKVIADFHLDTPIPPKLA